jgi:Zn-dependent protease
VKSVAVFVSRHGILIDSEWKGPVDLFRNIDIGRIAIQFAVLLFSLSIHEAAHAWMADRFGDYTARLLGRVTINPIPHIDPIGTILFPLIQFFVPSIMLLGWAKPVPVNPAHLRNPRKDHIFISIAGPAANLLAGGIAFVLLAAIKISWPRAFYALSGVAEPQSIMAPIMLILFNAMIINLALAIFNIIPIPPLDGHWVLSGLLPENAAASFERIGSYGFIILYALMFTGGLRIVGKPVEEVVRLLLRF